MKVRKMIKRIPLWISEKIDNYFVYHVSKVNPVLATRAHYFKIMIKKLNLNNPKEFNEKLQWLQLNTYLNNETVKRCVDKYRVPAIVGLMMVGWPPQTMHTDIW